MYIEVPLEKQATPQAPGGNCPVSEYLRSIGQS
jgi:hypothetical protein